MLTPALSPESHLLEQVPPTWGCSHHQGGPPQGAGTPSQGAKARVSPQSVQDRLRAGRYTGAEQGTHVGASRRT